MGVPTQKIPRRHASGYKEREEVKKKKQAKTHPVSRRYRMREKPRGRLRRRSRAGTSPELIFLRYQLRQTSHDASLNLRGLALLLLFHLEQQSSVDVWQHTTEGDGGANKGIEFLVAADRELEVTRGDALDLEVLGGVLSGGGLARAIIILKNKEDKIKK